MSTDPARLTDDEREDLWRAFESWTEGDFSEHMGEAVERIMRGHLGELERLRRVVARVEEMVAVDAAARRFCAEDPDCTCAYKDCYECGEWHNCTHTPYTELRAALEGR